MDLKSKNSKLKTANSIICFYLRLNEKLSKCIDITLSQFVRLVYMLQAGFCVYYLSSVMNSNYYYLILLGILLIFIDGIYVAIKRSGKEYTW